MRFLMYIPKGEGFLHECKTYSCKLSSQQKKKNPQRKEEGSEVKHLPGQ